MRASHRFVASALLLVCALASFARAAPPSTDAVRDLQAAAIRDGKADWGYWGSQPSKYTDWSQHSNRLIPVYTFGIDLASVRGEHSVYRSRERLEQLYGYLPTETLNPKAEYFDQTDVYRLQKEAAAAGKKRIILFIFDGMDWQTTQAAAIYKAGEVKYREGRGTGLYFQDYRGAPTDFGWCVTSPANLGTKVDVDSQTVASAGGKHGGFSWKRGGDTPWAIESDPDYPISKSRDCPHQYTDSAASATSMTTGIKTYDEAINVDVQGHPVNTITLQLQRQGFAVGAVTSVPVSHATPAAAYANNVHRDDYQDIARDLVGLRSSSHRDQPLPGLDVLLGTGWGESDRTGKSQGDNFVPGNKYITDADVEKIDVGHGGKYRVVERASGVSGAEALKTAAADAAANGWRLFGMFGAGKTSHLPYRTADGHFNPTEGSTKSADQYSAADLNENPRLSDIATAALTVLSRNPKGFWLMIEAGDVDWGNHDNNIDNSIGAVLDGDDAFHAVTDWIEAHGGWSDSAMIVTADHGHFFHLTKPEVIAEAGRKDRSDTITRSK
jgi:alkaline phosphatase